MQSRNIPINIRENPLVKSVFTINSDFGSEYPPVVDTYWVESTSGNQMITIDGDKYIFVTTAEE